MAFRPLIVEPLDIVCSLECAIHGPWLRARSLTSRRMGESNMQDYQSEPQCENALGNAQGRIIAELAI